MVWSYNMQQTKLWPNKREWGSFKIADWLVTWNAISWLVNEASLNYNFHGMLNGNIQMDPVNRFFFFCVPTNNFRSSVDP